MRTLALLVTVAAAGSGCGILSFDVDQDLPAQTIPGNPLGGVLPSFLQAPIPLQVDLKAETDKRGTGPATHAYLKSLTLSATPHGSPSGNFDFLDEVHVFVEPQSGALPKVEVATQKPVPRGQTSLDFTIVPNLDLLPYVNAGAQITASASGRQPQQNFSYDGHLTITIKL